MQSQAGGPKPHLSDFIILHNEAERLTDVMDRDNNFRGYASQIKAILKDNPNAVKDFKENVFDKLRDNVFDKMDPEAVQKSPEVRKSIQQFLQIFPNANSSVTLGNREFHKLLLAATSPTLRYALGDTTGVGLFEERKVDSKLEEVLYAYIERGEKFALTKDKVWDVLEFADTNDAQELIYACFEFIDKDKEVFKNISNQRKADLLDFATRRHHGWLQIRLLKIPDFITDNEVLARFEKERPHLKVLCEHFASNLKGVTQKGPVLEMSVIDTNYLADLRLLIANRLHIDTVFLACNDLEDVQEACLLLSRPSDIGTLRLSLYSKNVNEAMDLVSEMLSRNRTLTSFIPNSCDLTDQTVQNLAAALKKNSTLRYLDFSSVMMSDKARQALAEGINENSGLEILRFQNDFGELGAKALISLLKDLPSLRTLALGGCLKLINVTNLLAEEVAKHQSLSYLDLSHNNIKDEGAARLAGMLEKNRVLKQLILDNNNLTPAGIKVLADALLVNRTLEVLSLTNNKVGSEGLKALARVLEQNRTLKSLDLTFTGIVNDDSLEALETALRGNDCLEELKVANNSIRFDGASRLLAALQDRITPIELDLYGSFDEADIEELAALNTNPNVTLKTTFF